MKPIKTKDLKKLLESKGFESIRQSGSHETYRDASGRTVTLVNTREQAPGTLRNILKTAGLK